MNKPQIIRLKVYVQPGAKKSEIVGMHADAVKIRIKSPAIEGMANNALVEFLSKLLKVRKSAIEIEKGDKSRMKLIAIICDNLDEYERLTQYISVKNMIYSRDY